MSLYVNIHANNFLFSLFNQVVVWCKKSLPLPTCQKIVTQMKGNIHVCHTVYVSVENVS